MSNYRWLKQSRKEKSPFAPRYSVSQRRKMQADRQGVLVILAGLVFFAIIGYIGYVDLQAWHVAKIAQDARNYAAGQTR